MGRNYLHLPCLAGSRVGLELELMLVGEGEPLASGLARVEAVSSGKSGFTNGLAKLHILHKRPYGWPTHGEVAQIMELCDRAGGLLILTNL